VGQALAAACKDKNISNVVFDRNGFLFHGRVKALADAMREAGMKF
jgi:large subunit ribosomal protein L18